MGELHYGAPYTRLVLRRFQTDSVTMRRRLIGLPVCDFFCFFNTAYPGGHPEQYSLAWI